MNVLSTHIETEALLKKHELLNGTIYEAMAEDVYPIIEAGSVTLVHSDGPYAMGKADWDRMKVADLAAWYRPHIEAWGRLCAPSASIYHWGTAEGWAAVHPEYLRQGWTFKAMIVWDKKKTIAAVNPHILWPSVTEYCGMYARKGYVINKAHSMCNVWPMDMDSFKGERFKDPSLAQKNGLYSVDAVHPCQKPLAFADRMIRASSRPGDTILEPFGGTCRIAVACEQIARYKPADARRYVCVEMNADGVDYIGPVLRQIQENGKQVTLFEGFGR